MLVTILCIDRILLDYSLLKNLFGESFIPGVIEYVFAKSECIDPDFLRSDIYELIEGRIPDETLMKIPNDIIELSRALTEDVIVAVIEAVTKATNKSIFEYDVYRVICSSLYLVDKYATPPISGSDYIR
jgi:hypothetical protein